MKKVVLLAFAGLTISMAAQADCQVESTCGASSMTLMATTIGPAFTVSAPFMITSEALRNDIIMVQGEAIMALETGFISKELESVIRRIRIEADSQEMRSASDMEILEMLANENN